MILLLAMLALPADGRPSYEGDVRPILARECTICHSAKKLDKPDLSGGLALDSYEAVLKGTADHAVVVAGKAAESELYRRLADPDDDRKMPLLDEPLSASQRDLIGRWIDAGAPRGERSATSAGDAVAGPAPKRLRTLDVAIPVVRPDGKSDEALVKLGPLPAVSSLAMRPDGGLLAVGTEGRVVLWDLAEGRPAASLAIPGPAHALAFGRDGRRLAVGSGLPARSGSVRVYSVPDGALLHDFAGHADAVYALAFRPDGGQLASGGFDATVRLWDLLDGSPAGVFAGHSDFVYDLAYAPDGKTILSASKDRSIKRFDAATLKGLRTYSDHDADVLALAARPDGSEFVSAGDETPLRWWKPDAERPHRRAGGHSGPVFALAFSGDGRTLLSASGDRTVRVWDGQSGLFRRALPGPTEWQYAVASSHDGKVAAAGGWDGLVRVWDAEVGKLGATLAQPPEGWLRVEPGGGVEGSPELMARFRWKSGGTAP